MLFQQKCIGIQELITGTKWQEFFEILPATVLDCIIAFRVDMGMQEQPATLIEKRCVTNMGYDARAET